MVIIHCVQFICGFLFTIILFSANIPELPIKLFPSAIQINKPFASSTPINQNTSVPFKIATAIYVPCLVGGVSKKRKDKHGRDTFFIWYDFNGKRYNINSDEKGNSWIIKEEAEELLTTIRHEIKHDKHDPEKYRPENKNRYSFSNVLATYLESRKNDVLHGRIGEAQRRHIEKNLKDVLAPYIETERLRDIRELKAFHLEKLFNKHLPKWKPKTVKNFSLNLNAFFRWCVKMEYIDRIPALPNLPTAIEKPIKSLDEATQTEILKMIDEENRPIYQFMAWYGCRPREAMALQRRDVNWEGRFILIQRAFKHGTTELGSTKTRKIRPLPIAEETEGFIRKAYYGSIGEETFLFINPLTGKNYTISALEHRWASAWDKLIKSCEKAGKRPPERCTLTEGTRKTVASIAFNNGVDEKLVAGMLGNSPEILKKHYAQLAASRFNGVVGRGKMNSSQTVSKAKKGKQSV